MTKKELNVNKEQYVEGKQLTKRMPTPITIFIFKAIIQQWKRVIYCNNNTFRILNAINSKFKMQYDKYD